MEDNSSRETRIFQRIAGDLGLGLNPVRSVASLLDEGNTVPFIARYRKEMSGGMTDENVRLLAEKLSLYRNLEKRREDVARLLKEQGVLTPELESAVEQASTVTDLDDIYRPYRPKKRTRATIAKEKGLEPLAQIILGGEDPEPRVGDYMSEDKGVNSAEEALAGARDIIAEMVSDDPQVRQKMRRLLWDKGEISVTPAKEEESAYDMYYGFREPLKRIQPHRILAINRGEREGYLQVKMEMPEDRVSSALDRRFIEEQHHPNAREQLKEGIRDGWKRLLFPSLERETRSGMTEAAEEQALRVFEKNLKGLLLIPPVTGKRILGLDPGYRTGCKLACVDETGRLLETAVIYPTPPRNEKEASARIVKDLIQRHRLNAVAIGNGTGGRESEEFIAEVLGQMDEDVQYTVVNEAGASVYSASKLGQLEFPSLDVAERSAVSIARRVQDPMAELVKIDPKSIGVGQYQHDVNQRRLMEVLDGVVEACVNQVGVDLNTASAPLLERVAGINKTVANNIVARRQEKPFESRQELRKIPKLGLATFKQCAGFLRIPDAPYYFDRSAVHPESYEIAERLVAVMGISPEELGKAEAIPSVDIQELASLLETGELTLRDIVEEFRKPGRDPRDELPKPIFREGVLKIEDLREGMQLEGIVRNVVDFGAFVDIGVHQDGLVHISEISDKFIKHPLEAVKVGEVVKVRVLKVDLNRKRISLSMKTA